MNLRDPVWGVLVTAGFASACASAESVARNQFQQSWPCPTAQVTISKQVGRAYEPRPDPTVVADAARLAAWRKAVAVVATTHSGRIYYAVRGCGHDSLFWCQEMAATSIYGGEPASMSCDRVSAEYADSDLGDP